ncbi:enoyl-CoA hydratase/isomerase family protein [Gordonia insulae]|uniref:Putative enoyl-CoA hydratase echA8 n=1 Tax=Gordonia insulae TaxID=2420509 RepID=A0A3G8JLB7_9ACTN|nr:enoyl-CoA hydratase/isomerase family protein [Gordonia insulae]AZG45877.1 putative enoyl-CoA hydratase echA8 [Gordonia insulae]
MTTEQSRHPIYDAPPPSGDYPGSPYLKFSRQGPFAHLVVDRPEARNALTNAMYFGVKYAVKRVDSEPDLSGLVITGVGDVFIPGGDLGRNTPDSWTDLSMIDVLPFDTLRMSAKPVVSAINGLCQGGGLMIAMCSDISVAARSATFRVPELFRGIADLYYAQMLPRMVGPVRAKDLMFTGRVLSAAEAVEWGLINRVVPDEEVMDVSLELLTSAASTAPDARLQVKRVIDSYVGLHDRIGMADSLRGPEFVEGWKAFSERRPPNWVPDALKRPGRL